MQSTFKKLFEVANEYCAKSNWKTLALLKFCLFSIGILIGMLIVDSAKLPVAIIFGLIFVVTYIPLMAKFVSLWKKHK